MRNINKFKVSADYESSLSRLNSLSHYVAYDASTNSIHLKDNSVKKFKLSYNITSDVIDMANTIYNGNVLLLSRCDLFESIKVDGVEINWEGKERNPYEFTATTSNDLIMELQNLIVGEDGFNNSYVLYVNSPEIKSGMIEVQFKDVLPVNSLKCMLSFCNTIDNIEPEFFEVFNIINAISSSAMLVNCTQLTTLDLSKIDMSNITDISYMFKGCSNLINLDLSTWEIGEITDSTGMFDGCTKLNHIKCKSSFHEWCLSNIDTIKLPDNMNESGDGEWEYVD